MYPAWRYHISGESRIIHSEEQEQDGWESTVAAFGIETAPGVIPDPVFVRRRAQIAKQQAKAAKQAAAKTPAPETPAEGSGEE